MANGNRLIWVLIIGGLWTLLLAVTGATWASTAARLAVVELENNHQGERIATLESQYQSIGRQLTRIEDKLERRIP